MWMLNRKNTFRESPFMGQDYMTQYLFLLSRHLTQFSIEITDTVSELFFVCQKLSCGALLFVLLKLHFEQNCYFNFVASNKFYTINYMMQKFSSRKLYCDYNFSELNFITLHSTSLLDEIKFSVIFDCQFSLGISVLSNRTLENDLNLIKTFYLKMKWVTRNCN